MNTEDALNIVDQSNEAMKVLAAEVKELRDQLDRADTKVAELEGERLLWGPIEHAEKAIREAGGDPEQVGKDGASFVRALSAEKKVRELQAQLDRANSDAEALQSMDVQVRSALNIDNTLYPVAYILRLKQDLANGKTKIDEVRRELDYANNLVSLHVNMKKLDRKPTEPRPIEGGKRGEICDECGIDADIVTERLMQAQEHSNKLTLELLKSGNAYAELAKGLLADKPRPMSEAPRVWVGDAILVCHWIWEWSDTPNPCWCRTDEHELIDSSIFVPGHLPRPDINPSEMDAISTCSKVDWLPTTTGKQADSEGNDNG